MLLSDTIAKIIEQMISDSGGSVDLKRNDLAVKIGCVPSQINYVITSRFTPERGYVIESRRGGGGYIRIVKKELYKNEYLMHFFHAVGSELDEGTAIVFIKNLYDNDIINEREARLIRIAVLACGENNCARADVMRHVLLALSE